MTPPRMARLTRARALFILVAGIVACRDDATQPDRGPVVPSTAARSRIPASAIPAERLEMGDFQPVAAQIVRALQDSKVRLRLLGALRDPANRGLGIDLTDCSGATIAAELLQTGERRGGAAAAPLCALLKQRNAAVLYMDPRRLAGWDGRTIPIVTALAGLNRRMPEHLMGYRSPDVLIDIGADDKLVSPILVVVPATHPSRWPTGPNVRPPGSDSRSR